MYSGYVIAGILSMIYGTGRHVILVKNAKALTIVSPAVVIVIKPRYLTGDRIQGFHDHRMFVRPDNLMH